MSSTVDLAPTQAARASAVSAACWSPKELAEQLSISPMTLKNWRSQGRGPEFVRLSDGCVRYLIDDVMAWLLGNRDARNVGESS